MDEHNKTSPLASEIYGDLKREIGFKNKLIFILLGIIGALIIAMSAQHIYHVYQWSQFDTYVVDSGEGGNANLVQGDNTGGIFNGTDNGAGAQEIQQD